MSNLRAIEIFIEGVWYEDGAFQRWHEIGYSCSRTPDHNNWTLALRKRLTTTTATDLQVSMTNCFLQPVYRVKCYANNVKYDLILDAQWGAVLYREIDD